MRASKRQMFKWIAKAKITPSDRVQVWRVTTSGPGGCSDTCFNSLKAKILAARRTRESLGVEYCVVMDYATLSPISVVRSWYHTSHAGS